MNRPKMLFIAPFLLFAGLTVWGDDYSGVPLLTSEDADLYVFDSISARIKKNTSVLGILVVGRLTIGGMRDFISVVEYNGRNYDVLSNVLLPPGRARLPDRWISVSDPPGGNIWIISYYLDILRSRERSVFLNMTIQKHPHGK